MKKSIVVLLMIMVLLGGLAGCGKENESGQDEPLPVDGNMVVINGLAFQVDQEKEFNGVNYKAVKEFQEVHQNMYVQYNYLQEDSSNLLFFRIFYYRNQGFKAAFKDLGLENDIPLTPGSTPNIEYSFYEVPRDDGGTIHFYFIDYDGSTYVLHFASRYDISDFEQKTLNSIGFPIVK